MDEASNVMPSELPIERRQRHTRDRTTSFNSFSHFKSGPSKHMRPSTLRNRGSNASMRSISSETDYSEIIAPIPRRHLLQTSQSLHWLRVDTSSGDEWLNRGASPVSASSVGSGTIGAGRRFVRWMHRNNMKNWMIPSAIAVSTLVKWCIGFGTYSGHNTPPMFGDYEAQRHWMELTVHLPVREWYTYDLQYWGLDYPPLTAYVSWLCGRIGSLIEPSWFTLQTSRGMETGGSKLFMRATVLVLDLLIYIPALYYVYVYRLYRRIASSMLRCFTLLFHPALLLIDFGHFQYNSVMLVGHDLLGAILFVLSLGFKQMALYYAPAIGSYLIGKCIYLGPVHGTRLFMRLALTTILAFVIMFIPFLPPFSPLSTIIAPITRIFPFGRGLFEDKWKQIFASREGILIKASTGLTALGFLPATRLQKNAQNDSVNVSSFDGTHRHLHSPTPILPLLPYALLTCSMYMRKTILIPLLPLTLLLSGAAPTDDVFLWGALGNNVGVFSMWPLLKKDGLGLQYLAMLLLWNRLIGHNPFKLHYGYFVGLVSSVVHTAIILLHLLELTVTPPARYPDLFPVLNVLICTPIFGLIWLWSIKRSVEVSWAMSGLPGKREKEGPSSAASAISATSSSAAFGHSTIRGETGARAMSLGYASGRGRGQTDARRRALGGERGW
ncbi:glycosyltransferase family 57 protein [Suillus subalutaceus]|uniref:glycosyltransferase family 57 protein n=1 Tax=Suillus subalutaceus TaxID=48586 RepID=UPI001B882CC2|nr:glycosyltransferase family 57 protein [Suillus subalutaceus]KAG1844658.1 glycosyltransferase family 57 protein [Suillus subalutaceus]